MRDTRQRSQTVECTSASRIPGDDFELSRGRARAHSGRGAAAQAAGHVVVCRVVKLRSSRLDDAVNGMPGDGVMRSIQALFIDSCD